MRVGGLRITEDVGEVGLPRRGRQQVISADHLVHALRRIVDHDSEVVGRDAVAAAHHEVVDHAGVFAVQLVVHGVFGDAGAQPQGRRSSHLCPTGLPLGF